MRRATLTKGAGLVVGASLLGATLGLGSSAFAFSGNPDYYDISHLTRLARRAANTLYADGIMNGTAPGKFSPYGEVTRAQAVKFVVNALRLPLEPSAPQTYTDVSRQSQYYPYIEAAVKAGILAGMAPASGDFAPSTIITREEFSVLATNALGDQSLAQSLAQNLTKYGYLRDLGTVTQADLGDVNAMMEVGIVPPYDATRFAPFNRVNREEFAVAIMRLYNVLAARNLTAATLSAATPSTGVGQADQLTVSAQTGSGQTLSASALAAYTITYAVTGPNSASATVTPNGSFVATAPGTYTVDVSISGNGLASAVTATTQIEVYGAPTALKVLPKSPTLVADEAATDTVQVEALDAAGGVASSFDGAVTLSDTNHATELENAQGATQPGAVTVDAVNGIATFTVESTSSSAGLTDTLTATAESNGQSLTGASATIATVAQQATSIAVSAASNTLRANEGGNTDAISAVVDDQAGQPMLSGTYALTFTLTGPAMFSDGATTMPEAFIADGTTTPPAAIADIESEQGDTGTVNIIVTGAGLAAGKASVDSVIAGVPEAMKLSAASPSVAAGATDAITVELVDASGVPTTTAAALPVTATVSENGNQVGTLSGTIAAGAGSTTLAFRETGVGTYTVTVAAQGFPTASLGVAVSSGQATALSLSPSGPVTGAPVDLSEGEENVPVTVQLVDADGNAVTEAGIPVTFSASGGNGTYAVNGSSGSVTVDTGANGTAQATFAFGSSTGTWTVTAASNGLTSATQSFEVVPYAATEVSVELNQTGPVSAGSTISGTITAEQPNGTADGNADYLGVTLSPASGMTGVTFTDPNNHGATITPISSQDGVYLVKSTDGQIDFTGTAATAGELTVKATDESVVAPMSASATVEINASTVPGGALASNSQGQNLSTTPLTVAANEAVPVTVSLTDGFGNDVVSNVPVTVALADLNGTASAGGAFRSSADGADYPNNEVTIPAGSAGVTVWYVNATAGSYTIDAQTPGLLTGVASAAGTAGAGTITLHFADVPNGGSVTADTTAAAWTVEVNGQTLPTADYSVGATGTSIVFTLSAGYQSGQAFSIAEMPGNTSATSAGVALSVPSATFGAQTLG